MRLSLARQDEEIQNLELEAQEYQSTCSSLKLELSCIKREVATTAQDRAFTNEQVIGRDALRRSLQEELCIVKELLSSTIKEREESREETNIMERELSEVKAALRAIELGNEGKEIDQRKKMEELIGDLRRSESKENTILLEFTGLVR